MIVAISKIVYNILFSTREYFGRYGNDGTRGRTGAAQPKRGGWNNQKYIHTAKNEFGDIY